jgi:hypothetical protein
MADRFQAKFKAMDTSVLHSWLIRMLLMEELKKRNVAWEQFIVSANMQLNVAPTPQSKVESPLQAEISIHTDTIKNIKGKHIAKDSEASKEVEEEEGGAHHSPQREFSPQPAPELEEVPSTKTTVKKGRNLLFPSPTIAVKTRDRRPFTKSSA